MSCSAKSTKNWLRENGFIKGNKVIKDLTPANHFLIEHTQRKFNTRLPEAIYKSGMSILYKDRNGNLRMYDVFFNFVDNLIADAERKQAEFDRFVEEAYQDELEDAKRAGYKEEDFDRFDAYNSFGESDFYHKGESKITSDLNDYGAYYNYKTDLISKLQHKLISYRILNKHNKHTTEYKKTVSDYLDVINNLTNELEQLKNNEPEIVFSSVANEIEYLYSIIDEGDINKITNQEVINRIDFLSKLITGKDIEGNHSADFMWDGRDYTGYADNIVEPFMKLKVLYSKRIRSLTKQILFNSEIFKAHKDLLSEDGVNALFEDSADINTIQKLFYGLNANDDTAAITILYSALQENLQKVEQVTNKLGDELEKADKNLKDAGIELDIFFETDSGGVQTGNIIDRFTKLFRKEAEKFNSYVSKYFNATISEKKDAYDRSISWLKTNAEVIDFTKLKYFKDIFGDNYPQYFTATESEMDSYEAELKNLLGREYDSYIKDLEYKLIEYENYKNKQKINPTNFSKRNIVQSDPFIFIKNFYSDNAFKKVEYTKDGTTYKTYNFDPRFFSYIPKRTVYDVDTDSNQDTGYYNDSFKKIENSEVAYKYWKLLKDIYTTHINPVYESMGQNVSEMSWAKFEKSFTEEVVKSQGIKGFFKNIINRAIAEFKNLWFEKGYYQEKSGVRANYNDVSRREVNRLKKLLNLKSVKELQKQALELGIIIDDLNDLLSKSPDMYREDITAIYKEDLVDMIARQQVLDTYSKDLTKSTLNLLNLAALHKARTETESIVNIVRNFHRSIKNIGDGQERKNSNSKLDSWIKKKIYNIEDKDRGKATIVGREFSIKRLTDLEKNIKKLMKDVQDKAGGDGSISFEYNGIKYTKKNQNYTSIETVDNEDIKKTLSAEEFEDILTKYFTEESKKLGIGLSISGIILGMIKLTIAKTLALNVVSGVRNLIEGLFVNTIVDSSGEFWTKGNYKHSVKFFRFANSLKISDYRLPLRGLAHKRQLQSMDLLLKRLNIIQDKKNLLARNDKVSKFNKWLRKLNPFAVSVDNPEYKIQGTMIAAKLMDVTIKDIHGVEHKFFDGKKLTAYVPGTTTLKEEFRTEENMGWETFTLNSEHSGEAHNRFFSFKMEATDMINQKQGNYFSGDNIAAMDSLFGKAAMVFMRWMPSYYLQRVEERNTNIIQGKDRVVGRYKTLWKHSNNGVIGTFASIALGLTVAPTVGLTVGAGFLAVNFIVRKIIHATLDPDTNIKTATEQLTESLDFIKQIVLSTLNMPFIFFGSNVDLSDTAIGRKLDSVSKRENLTETEKYAIKGVAQEVVNYLSIISVSILLKALLYDDDDDEDDTRRQLYNFIDNQTNMILDGWTAFLNPAQTWEDSTSLAILRQVDATRKLCFDLVRYMTWGDIEGSEILYDIGKVNPFLPTVLNNTVNKAIFKDELPFFSRHEYKKGQWHDYLVKDAEEIAKKKLVIARAKYKAKKIKELTKDLERRGVKPHIIEERVEKQMRKIMRSKELNRTRNEKYIDALERVKAKTK